MSAPPVPAWWLPLLSWQQEATTSWFDRRPANDLAFVTPGAGKTIYSARIAHRLFEQREIDYALVVVPRRHLCKQVGLNYGKVGLRAHLWRGNAQPGYHVGITTYQQLGLDPLPFCDALPTRSLVVFDEAHHLGDQTTWGESATLASSHVDYRLLLSGTPWRTDDYAIPFAPSRNGRYLPGYEYSYADAVRDGVCRPLIFHLLDGTASWDERATDEYGEETTIRRTVLSASLASKARLPQWMRTQHEKGMAIPLFEAHQRLTELRRTVAADAGGLVVARNQQHARRLADILAYIVGTEIPVAISDDSSSARIISSFSEGSAPWLVAVNMVSEGVDIPRLRVGVYATSIVTPLYLWQFLGRFVRGVRDRSQSVPSEVWILAHPALVRTIETISEVSQRALARGSVAPPAGPEEGNDEGTSKEPGATVRRDRYGAPIAADLSRTTTYHLGGTGSSAASDDLPPASPPQPDLQPLHVPSPPEENAWTYRQQLATNVKRLATKVAKLSNLPHPGRVYGWLNSRCGDTMPTASIETLTRRMELLQAVYRKKSATPAQPSLIDFTP